jgi:hypothetical protein
MRTTRVYHRAYETIEDKELYVLSDALAKPCGEGGIVPPGGKAIRYGIGVGREGSTWSGVKTIERKAVWPDWTPPTEMIARSPYVPRFMAGGGGNPLGARAIYLSGSLSRLSWR